MSERVCQGCGGPLPPSRNPSVPRKWCSERCRKTQYTECDPCTDCGAPTSSGPRNGRDAEPRCDDCRRDLADAIRKARDADVIALRAEGLLNHEIAAAVGASVSAIATRTYRIRTDGNEVARTAYGPAAARAAQGITR